MNDDHADQQTNADENTKSSRKQIVVNLLVLAAIAILLFLLLIPATRSAGPAARRAQSINNLKNIDLAQKNFATQSNGAFATPTLVNEKGEPVHGWFTQLLPLLDQPALYDKIDLSVPWNHRDNQEYTRLQIDYCLNPGLDEQQNEDGYPRLHYTLNERMFPNNVSLTEDYVSRADGLANTILMGEIQEGLPAWAEPGNARDPSMGFRPGPNTMGVSVWGGVTLVGFADGRVRSINNDIDPAVLKALSTPDGGEVVPEDY